MTTQPPIDTTSGDPIYREAVERARAMSPADRMAEGLRLFELGLQMTRAGVQDQLGTDDAGRIDSVVLERFDRVRRVRERGLYRNGRRPHEA